MMQGGAPPDFAQQFGNGAPPEAPPPEQGGDVSAILNQILDLAGQYRDQEQDQGNLLLVEQLRTIAQKILANEQKMADDLMQGKASPQAIRRYAG
jgi:hypothetical protein